MSRRKLITLWTYFGRRYQHLVLLIAIFVSASLLTQTWWVARVTSSLRPPSPLGQDLRHFRRERNLKRYLDSIQLLIEPTSLQPLCEGVEEVPLLVLVSSSPSHLESRQVIRQTWAQQLPTFFFLGLDRPEVDEQLVEIYIEAKQYGDMVVYDFADHYQNMTLKSVLMLQWSQQRCPQAEALFKTDDDVFVNPWTLRALIQEHVNDQLIGYRINNTKVHRDEYTKWYLPRWLYPEDHISEYLSGTGYIINGEYIEKILKAAHRIPIINLEDVYLTNLVAKKELHLTLSHDRRLSPYKPWLSFGCFFWDLASAHSLSPDEIVYAWSQLSPIVKQHEKGREVCSFLSFFSNDLFLY